MRLIGNVLLTALALAGLSIAQERISKNPREGNPEAVRAGGNLYGARCSDCHGVDAKGVRGPDLTVLWSAGAGDDRLFQTIRRGVPGTEMPANNIPDDDIWSILAYLRTLETNVPIENSRGDAANGERIFWTSCGSCHRVNGRGGRLGPDLSRIGAGRSRAALIREIRDPSATMLDGYQPVRLVTADGQQIRGAKKNEDALTVQIMDTRERLQGYVKANLREFTNDKQSLMPAYGADRLSERDLDDLLRFLNTLRGLDQAAVSREAQQAPLGGVTFEDLLGGLKNPSRWLTYSGEYNGRRHSPLTQINPSNVNRLTAQWTFQSGITTEGRGFESTPIVLDGVLYVTGSNNSAWALDARSGRPFWRYRYPLPQGLTSGSVYSVNRGFGILGDRLFMTTLDAHLIALDMKTGTLLWDVMLEDYKKGYSATLAPLIVKDKVVIGISGGEYATRGFIEAYDARSGKRVWRFNTIPTAGEPGSETWPSTNAAARAGGTAWVTGSYDPELNLLYWGTGNPNPDFYGADRQGDNLYTSSIVALDVDTGKLKWHYQFTPHDTHDWDSNHVPVLADVTIGGQPRKAVMVANRNGFFYALDRTTGKLLFAKPFTETNWAREIGADGRPIVLNEDGSKNCIPDVHGGTNFMPPSYDPALRLFFVTARETCVTYFPVKPEVAVGQPVMGGGLRRERDRSYGAIRALDATTGDLRWEFRYMSPTMAGVMSTAAGLVFGGDNEGNFMAFDSRNGKRLWSYPTGSPMWGSAPSTYVLDGRQYIVMTSGTTLVTFALPER
jgi:PQQ-dependent dehydrogenase (methanol/ethanol family)